MHLVALTPAVLAASLALPAILPVVPAPAAASAAAEPAPLAEPFERVQLTTEDKLSLVAAFYAPKDQKQKSPGAVLVHDAGGSRADLEPLAVRLQKQGFAVLTVDLRGHGESATAESDWKKANEETRLREWSLATRDVKAAAEYMRGREIVQSTNLSLVGYRSGGSLVARHAVRDEGVRDLVLIDPQPDNLGYALVKDLEELSGLPTFIAVTKEEQPTAKRLAEAAQRNAADKEFIEVCLSKDEDIDLLADKKLQNDVVKWMLDKAMPKKTAIEK
jgi:dienelactone hydrolase